MAAIAPPPHSLDPLDRPHRDLLAPLRSILNHLPIRHPHLARLICKLIPPSCPFERDVKVFHHTIHIPPLCKLNPLFNEIIALRFRALSYLADECGIDISHEF